MQETIGLLDLKIARLRRRLEVLQQEITLSDPYPQHKADLFEKDLKLRLELYRLFQKRQEMTSFLN